MNEARYLHSYYLQERNRAQALTAEKQVDNTWGGYRDSSLLGGFPSFDHSFKRVIPSENNIKDYIEKKLASKQFRRAIEFGGRGYGAFSGFTEGFFDETFAVSMDAPERSTRDIEINHTIIPGNILTKEVQEKVKEAHNGEKFDFILLRMLYGQDCLPADPFFMSQHANFAYEQLAVGGVMLVEVPYAFYSPKRERGKLMQLWQSYIRERYVEQLDVDYYAGHLRLVKLEGAPEHLPLLPARVVLREEKDSLHSREAGLRDYMNLQRRSPGSIEEIIQKQKAEFVL